MKEDMKKLAKAAANAATKALPSLEQRVAACEAKEDSLDKVPLQLITSMVHGMLASCARTAYAHRLI